MTPAFRQVKKLHGRAERAGVIACAAVLLFLNPVFAAEDASLRAKLMEFRQSGANPDETRLAAILENSVGAYEGMKDYTAEFHKQEASNGALGERETIFLKFEKPFKIFMHWFDTHKKGLQVLYERGGHGGKLAIHKPGLLLGLAPVIFLDRSSPWVREGSESYDIEDAGIGAFLYDFSRMVLRGSAEKKIQVRFSQDTEGEHVDVSFPGSEPSSGYFASRVTVLFDARSRLPVRMSLYDWDGKPTGIYEYRNLNMNIGADDPEFKRLAERHLYRLFLPFLQRVSPKTNFSSQ